MIHSRDKSCSATTKSVYLEALATDDSPHLHHLRRAAHATRRALEDLPFAAATTFAPPVVAAAAVAAPPAAVASVVLRTVALDGYSIGCRVVCRVTLFTYTHSPSLSRTHTHTHTINFTPSPSKRDRVQQGQQGLVRSRATARAEVQRVCKQEKTSQRPSL